MKKRKEQRRAAVAAPADNCCDIVKVSRRKLSPRSFIKSVICFALVIAAFLRGMTSQLLENYLSAQRRLAPGLADIARRAAR